MRYLESVVAPSLAGGDAGVDLRARRVATDKILRLRVDVGADSTEHRIGRALRIDRLAILAD